MTMPRTIWTRTEPNDDPQDGAIYLHVSRNRRRAGYITDTVFHIKIAPPSGVRLLALHLWTERTKREARAVIAAVRKSRAIKRWTEDQLVEGFDELEPARWLPMYRAILAMQRAERAKRRVTV